MSSQPARASRPLPAYCPSFPCILAPSVCFTFVSRLVAPPCFLPFSVRSSFLPVLYVAMSSQPARAFRPLPACCPSFPRILAPSVCFTFASRLASCLSPSVPLSFPSRMLRFHRNLPALSARFPPVARSSSSSRLFPPASRSALSSSSSPPAWPQYRKSPPGLLSEGF